MPETYFETFVQAVEACTETDGILGEEYLVIPAKENFGYAQCPRNGLTFGAMGVDGVHYTILQLDGEVRDDSPIIQVSPMDSEPYSLLGTSLLEYLAKACGVKRAEMEEVFRRQRSGEQALIPFMKQHFDQSRLHELDRTAEFAEYRDLIEEDVL